MKEVHVLQQVRGGGGGRLFFKDKHLPRVQLLQTMRREDGGPQEAPEAEGPLGTMARVSRRQLLCRLTEHPVCFGGQSRAAGQCQPV